ncbi:syrP protein [Nostoc cf. commune SO-36]|uniref:SyrP protein n=1 Tax=Nostoc cf. commune SO-36 TaxID=449208 RepID=A0ABN6QE35_NOSCO|nr:TauD/TfdA family dioxygenase [Nostoc commune]BDI19717.1 syrP protein [Nostoc cf. commune SO-36]
MLTDTEKQQKNMVEAKHEEIKLKKFIGIKPKSVKLPAGELIKNDYLQPEQTLPLVIKPNINDIDIIDWAKNNREFLSSKLKHHGAILFRDCNINSVATFEKLAQAICPELFGEYGDLPREEIGSKVYGSTPYPEDQAILFHNESSHMHCWPLKIWFFCLQPAQQGGETPIVDCRKLYQLLNSQIRETLEKKQLMYVRNYIEGLDVSWQDFFHTSDKTVVENYCHKAGIEFEWLPNNNLRTRKIRPAIVNHPYTGEKVFFNQIQLHHISCLEATVRESLLSIFGETNVPRNVYYGDGSAIEDAVMAEINQVYQQATISFPWQQGDVLMLDNMLTAHGRFPYIGPRKIVVAMGEMMNSVDV